MLNKILYTVIASLITLSSYSQVSGEQLDKLIENLKLSGKSEEVINQVLNGAIDDPELYNDIWKKLVAEAMRNDSSKWKFLNDLNAEFKTFQTADSSQSSLGISYDFNFNYAKFQEKNPSKRISNSLGLVAKGNIAFDKAVNPNDFLETNLNYSYSKYNGGIVKQSDDAVFTRLNEIEDSLVNLKDPGSKKAMQLWNNFGKYITYSNQYYYSISPKFGLESNQDFSKTQFTPGVQVNLGIKSWDKKSKLSKLNIFDYPFALLRLITGTDKSFTPYGSTLPTVRVGIDYVIPQNDTIRELLVDNLDPFPRFTVESGFKTFISRFKKENIFFNANIRYYYELDADSDIQEANLDEHFYFVVALQSSNGLFVSYANGKLPFDAINDEVYSIGFNYNF